MTALVSAFSRAYHSRNNEFKIFDDNIAKKLLSEEEYLLISESMSKGIGFFNPEFTGEKSEALRWIVDNQLSPSPLARTAFAEASLETATKIGARQYLIFASGYDTFAYRQPEWAKKLSIFEIDLPQVVNDKIKRLERAKIKISNNVSFVSADLREKKWIGFFEKSENFDKNKISFCSLLGLSYYLQKSDFEKTIEKAGKLLSEGSTIVFDYPDENSYTDKAGERAKKQMLLASGAGEKMVAGYSYKEIEEMLSGFGFLIYEHLTPNDITAQYFDEYNKRNTRHKMSAFDNVNYCLAVKKK